MKIALMAYGIQPEKRKSPIFHIPARRTVEVDSEKLVIKNSKNFYKK